MQRIEAINKTASPLLSVYKMPRRYNTEPSRKKAPNNAESKEKREEKDITEQTTRDFDWYEEGIERCLRTVESVGTGIPGLDNLFAELERRNDAVGALVASMYSKARTLVEFVDMEGGVRLLRQGYASLQKNIEGLRKTREEALARTAEMAECAHLNVPTHTSTSQVI